MRHGSHVVNKSKTHLRLRMMENFNKKMITLKKSKRKFKENINKKGIIGKDLIEEA